MSKTGKSLIWVVVGIAVIVAIAVTILITNLDRIVKNGIETYGSAATGVPVSVGSVDVSIRDGSGMLKRLRIGNPSGFNTDHAFQLDSIELALDAQSVTTDTIVIENLAIDAARLVAEYRGMDESNLDVISSNLEAYAGPTKESGQASAMRVVIEQFHFSNGELRVLHEELGVDRTVPIPEFTLEGIGREGAGVTVAQAARRMLQPIIQRALEAAREEALQRGRQQLEDAVREGVGDLLGGQEGDGNGN